MSRLLLRLQPTRTNSITSMKTTPHTALFVLCAFLSACSAGISSPSVHDSVQQQTVRAAGISALSTDGASSAHPASTTPTCPAQTFDIFLMAFANDVAVQKAFVTQPLQSESVDALAEPEPRPITKMLGFDQLHFPLMPNLQRQALDGLQLVKTISGNGEMEVKLVKPDTDYQVLFFFRNDGCWKLYRMRDDSL